MQGKFTMVELSAFYNKTFLEMFKMTFRANEVQSEKM